jgi:hypothetical protein
MRSHGVEQRVSVGTVDGGAEGGMQSNRRTRPSQGEIRGVGFAFNLDFPWDDKMPLIPLNTPKSAWAKL